MSFKRIWTFVLSISMMFSLLTDGAVYAASSDDGELVIAEFNTQEAIDVFESTFSKTKIQTKNTRDGGNDAYALFTVNPFDEQYINLYDGDKLDISDYNYINMWVYAPKAKDADLSLYFYDEIEGRDGAEADSVFSPFVSDIGFKGWKLISFDITGIGNDLARLSLKVNADKFKELTGRYAALWHEKGNFGIEKVWFSYDEPGPANEVPAIVSKPVAELKEGDIRIADFNTQSAVSTVSTSNGSRVVNTENNNLYGMNLRLKWDRAATAVGTDASYFIPNYHSDWTKGEKASSAIVFDAGNASKKIKNLTADSYINLWLYNPQIRRNYNGQYSQIGLHIFTGSSANGLETSGGGNYKIAGIIANWSGWKLVSIRIGDLTTTQSDDTGYGRGNIIANGIHRISVSANYNSGGILRTSDFTEKQLAQGFRGGSYDNDKSMVVGFNTWPDVNNFIDIDRVWISKEKPEAEIVGEDIEIDIAEFYNEEAIENVENNFSGVSLASDNAREGGNSEYAKFDVEALKEQKAYLCEGYAEDLSEINFLNMWIYSPEISGGGITFVAYDEQGNMAQKSINLDFKGWRLVSADVSDMYFELSRLEMIVNGFKLTDYTGKYSSLWHKNGSFGIEKIWFSRLKPDGSAYEAVLEETEAISGASDDIWSLDLNNEDTINSLGRHGDNTTFTATAENKKLYGMSGRLAWTHAVRNNPELENPSAETNAGTDEWEHKLNTNGVCLFKAQSTEEKIRGLTEDSYLNLWIYNPQIKKSVNGEITQIPIQLYSGPSSEDYTTIKSADNYKIVGVIANWTGWKLVSIRLGDVTTEQGDETGLGRGNLLEFGIHTINININDRAENSPRGFTDVQSERGWRGGTGSGLGFNGWGDRFNFIDIDRAWISNGKPKAEFNKAVFSHSDKKYISPLDKTFTIKLDNPIDASYIEAVKQLEVTAGGNQLSADAYNVSVNEANDEITVNFASDLECGKNYSIALPSVIRDIYTNKYSGNTKFSFDTMSLEMVEVKDSVNQKTEDDIKAVLEQYKLTDKVDLVAKVLTEQKPFNDYDEIVNMIKIAEEKLDELNNLHWSGVCDFFEENKELLFADETDGYDEYLDLSEKNQNSVNQLLIKAFPVESFVELRAELEIALDDYDKGNTSGGGSSGGGGGGSSSGSKSSQSVTFSNDIISGIEANDVVSAKIFNDLESVAWAEDKIMSLYSNGVIAASEDGNFRPMDNVKREEFVKMLVAALGIEPCNEASGFTDSRTDAWFEPYISAAKANGITMGKEDGSFGIGENITRQDMAVMVQRAVSAVNKSIAAEKEELVFDDASDISGYAKAAVAELQRAGIINGVSSSSFEPLSNANRAQAAVIIAVLIDKLR